MNREAGKGGEVKTGETRKSGKPVRNPAISDVDEASCLVGFGTAYGCGFTRMGSKP